MSDPKIRQRTYNDALQEQINRRDRHMKALERRSDFEVIEGGGKPTASPVEVTIHPGAEKDLTDIIDREARQRREFLASQGFEDSES